MSKTSAFVCDGCKKSCWCGQGKHLYTYQYIADFLHDHSGHKLRFISDSVEDITSEDYEEVDTDSEPKPFEPHTVTRRKLPKAFWDLMKPSIKVAGLISGKDTQALSDLYVIGEQTVQYCGPRDAFKRGVHRSDTQAKR